MWLHVATCKFFISYLDRLGFVAFVSIWFQISLFFVCQNAAFLCRILPNLVKIETTIINVANSNLLLLGLIQFVKTDSKENTESNVNVEGVSNCYQQQTASESKDIQYFETDKCKRKNNQFRVCSQMCLCIRGTDMSWVDIKNYKKTKTCCI